MARLLTDGECVQIARKERGCVIVEIAHSDEFWNAARQRDTGKMWDLLHAILKAPTHLEGGSNGNTEIERRRIEEKGSRPQHSEAAEQEGSGEGAPVRPEG